MEYDLKIAKGIPSSGTFFNFIQSTIHKQIHGNFKMKKK